MSNQGKKARQEYIKKNGWFIDLFPAFELVEKEEIVERVHMSERQVRDLISEMALYQPVLSLTYKKGYERVGNINELNDEQKKELLADIDHQLHDYNSRIKKLKQRQYQLYAVKKTLEKEGF